MLVIYSVDGFVVVHVRMQKYHIESISQKSTTFNCRQLNLKIPFYSKFNDKLLHLYHDFLSIYNFNYIRHFTTLETVKYLPFE